MIPANNPWLRIPVADYEGHMRSAGVQQLDALADLFGEALAICRPRSVAILGVAGGNGLEHVDAAAARRVVGVDLNPEFLTAVRQRFGKLPLELHCLDLASEPVEIAPAQLVHAALIFEHAGVDQCFENALKMVAVCH